MRVVVRQEFYCTSKRVCRQILDRFLLLFQNYSKMNRAKNVIDEGELVDDRNGVTANSAGID